MRTETFNSIVSIKQLSIQQQLATILKHFHIT